MAEYVVEVLKDTGWHPLETTDIKAVAFASCQLFVNHRPNSIVRWRKIG